MTGTTNRYGIYEVDRTKFGGIIYPSDFNTDYRGKDNTNGSQIASRILCDDKLYEHWKKNGETKERYKYYGK